MTKEQIAWECKCGHIEYGQYPPEECVKCWKVNSFSTHKEEDEEADEMLEEENY